MRSTPLVDRPRVAEFFAGIGLVRMAMEKAGFQVVWANDIDPVKYKLYAANFDAAHFVLGDVTDPASVNGDMIPDIDVATASFPCTDLSLAGNRAGLMGEQSGTFWGFFRVLTEMEHRGPRMVVLENVPSLATSGEGEELVLIIRSLNALGYTCDMFVADARHFVPQSRPRLFVVGSMERILHESDWEPSEVRPRWVQQFVRRYGEELALQAFPLKLPKNAGHVFSDVVEKLDESDWRWWEDERCARFVKSLSPVQRERLEHLRSRD